MALGKTGAVYDYGFRIYDTRIAKFLSVDLLTSEYPYNSPYAFSENRVIDAVELEGLEKYIFYNMRIGEENGWPKIKKVYANTIEGWTDSKGKFHKYEKQWVLRDYLGFTTSERVFSSKEEIKEWKGSFWDLYSPMPEEVKDDMIWGTFSELAGRGGVYDRGNNLINLINLRDYKKLKESTSIVIVVGSFKSKENATAYMKI